jgi:hypothetical protein
MKTVRLTIVTMVLTLARAAFGQPETFDVATFTPPTGWQRTESPGVVSFQHSRMSNGRFSSCQIFVFASGAGANPAANFQAEWYAKITQPLRTLAQPNPQMEITPDGWTAYTSFVDIPQNGLPYRTILYTYTATGSNRFISVVVNYTVDAYQSEIVRFFESLHLRNSPTPQNVAPPQSPGARGPAPAGGRLADYVYTLPDAWARQNAPNAIVLVSPVYQGGEQCQLSLLPMRAATRSLPDDALNIYREVFKAEPLTGDIYPPTQLFRGTSPQGWEYFVVKKPLGPSGGNQIGTILMVARVGSDLATVVGTSKEFLVSNCFGQLVRDLWPPFFYSLRFGNVTGPQPDQAALRQRLAGVWIAATATVGLRYEFSANGRYSDAGRSQPLGAQTTLTSFGNGSYSFDGNTLIMTGDDKRRTTAQFRLEQQSKDFGRSWTDTMCLLSPGGTGEVCYNRDR